MDRVDLKELSGEEIVERLQKDINGLQSEDFAVRQRSLETLLPLVSGKPPLKARNIYSEASQYLFQELYKPLLKRVSDSKEKCRELAISALKEYRPIRLLSRCHDSSEFLLFLFPVLVDQLGAYDLEGVAGLPEPMKPSPSQKPQVVRSPPEPSEENRVLLAQLVHMLVSTTSPEHFAPHLDELTSVLRALAMDPANPDVKITACMAISELSRHAPQLIHHYSESLVRSLYSCFIHKQWKVRQAAVEALGQAMFAGTFKYNSSILEELIGFRDPNLVPIKDFYEPSTKLNYFAMLVSDRSTHVREMFYSTVGEWLCRLPDRYDLESRLTPYLLCGLFDPLPEIQNLCFEAVEEVGQIYEEEKEKDIREIRQFGYQEPWTCDGLMSDLPLPAPFAKRPRLGARLYFRQYVRRYLTAIIAELNDWISSSRIKAANLLLALTIFAEDSMTQHTDKVLACVYRAVNMRGHEDVTAQLEVCIRLLGRYLDPETYTQHVISNLRGDLLAEQEHQRSGIIKVLRNLLTGLLEALPSGHGTSRLDPVIEQLLGALHSGLSFFDSGAVLELGKLLHDLVKTIETRKQDLKDVSALCRLSGLLVAIMVETEAALRPHGGSDDQESMAQMNAEAIAALISIINFEEVNQGLFNQATGFHAAVGALLVQIQKSAVESWHFLSEEVKTMQWKCFSVLIQQLAQVSTHSNANTQQILGILLRLVSSETTLQLHGPALKLLILLHAEDQKSVEKVIVLCLKSGNKSASQLSTVRTEAITLAKAADHRTHLLTPELLSGLIDSLSDPDALIRSEALKLLHDKLVPFSDSLFSGQGQIDAFKSGPDPLFPLLVEKLLGLLDDPSREVRLIVTLPLLVLLKTLPMTPDDTQMLLYSLYRDVRTNRIQKLKVVVNEFEMLLIGDLRKVIQKVLQVLLEEERADLKEKCHECLVEIRKRNSRMIAAECLSAKNKGYLKRWEYLTVLLEAT